MDAELSFAEGDAITVQTSQGAWWVGVDVAGVQGAFPFNYVKVASTGDGEEAQEGDLVYVTCVAIADYDPTENGGALGEALVLAKGDVLMACPAEDEGWWYGSMSPSNGGEPLTGFFPLSCIEVGEED